MYLKFSQNSPENTCARISFFNKVAGWGLGQGHLPFSRCVFNCNFLQILELQYNNISVNITSITATYNVNKAGVSVHIFTGKYIFHQDILAQLYFRLLFSDLKNKHTNKQKTVVKCQQNIWRWFNQIFSKISGKNLHHLLPVSYKLHFLLERVKIAKLLYGPVLGRFLSIIVSHGNSLI